MNCLFWKSSWRLLQYQCISTSSSFTEVTYIPEMQEPKKEEKQPKNKGPQTTEGQTQECLIIEIVCPTRLFKRMNERYYKEALPSSLLNTHKSETDLSRIYLPFYRNKIDPTQRWIMAPPPCTMRCRVEQ